MATVSEQIQEIYIGLLGRAADKDGLDYWTNEIDNGVLTIEQLRANIVNEQAEYAAGLGSMTRSQQVIELYDRLFNRVPDNEGLTYWVDGDGSSVNEDQLVLALINGASGFDRLTLDNKTEAAEYYTANTNAYTSDSASAAVADVDGTRESVEASKAATDSYTTVGGETYLLSTGQDVMSGTSDNDLFIARGNSSLDNADFINGGAGRDTLEVMLDNSETAESPALTNIEVVEVQAQDTTPNSGDNDVNRADNFSIGNDEGGNDDNYETNIDAGDFGSNNGLGGVEEFWSVDSRADLVIEDVSRNSHITTVGMRETDPGDTDFSIFFDPENITGGEASNTGAFITLDILDQLNAPAEPLKQHSYVSFDFTFNGEVYTVTGLQAADTYEELRTLIEQQLVNDLGLDVSVNRIANGFTDPNGVPGDRITVTANDGSDITNGNLTTGESKIPNEVDDTYGLLTDTVGVDIPALTSVEVVLDRVGKGSKAGDLLIGSDSTGNSGSQGIEQFNIDVDRDSWLSTVSSTNNTLEVITVENISDNNASGDGDLMITAGVGNNGIQDVRVFDASAMEGDVTLDADLSANVTAKYLNLRDTATDSSADNSHPIDLLNVIDREFSYDFGAGDDSLFLTISDSNLETAGTTNREDFVLEVNGNAGDDTIETRINTGTVTDADHWYLNSKENANLTVNGGAGNDEIKTTGAGDFMIDAGTGDDTVYADNSGNVNARATVNEVQTITFGDAGDLATQSEVTVTLSDGQTFTTAAGNSISTGDTATQVATKVRDQINATAVNVTASLGGANNDQVVLTYGAAYAPAGSEDIANAVVTGIASDTAVTVATTTGGVDGTDGVDATNEVAVIQLAAVVGATDTVTFDNGAADVDIVINDTDGNGTISLVEATDQIVAAAGTLTNWTLVESNSSLGLLAFQSNTAGNVDDLGNAAEPAVSSYTNAGAPIVVEDAANPIQPVTGADATPFVAGTAEVQTITVTNGADQAGTVTMQIDLDADGAFAGDGSEEFTFNVTAGDEGSVAAQLVAQINGLNGVSAAQGAAGATIDDIIITWDTKTATSDGGSATQDAAVTTFTDGAVKSASVAETVKGLEATSGAPATWVVNAVNNTLSDLDSAGPGATSLLYGARLTVTYSGAATNGESGVIAGAASAFSNGFESTVVVGTQNNVGNQTHLNQAIKDAIIGDGAEGGAQGSGNVLEELLSVNDGPANTIAIHSLIDGEFAESDLTINVTAATFTDLSAAEQASLRATWADMNNDSTAVYTDAQMQAALDAAAAAATASSAVDMATTNGTTLITGSASTAVSDNTIEAGAGNDVFVLGTDDQSNDTLVFSQVGTGNDTVVNFTETGTGMDSLDFSAFLNAQTSASGSAASAVNIGITLNSDTVASANEVVILNNFAGGSVTAGFTTDTVANLVGTTYNTIFMAENGDNDGEYDIYNVEVSGGDFGAVTLIGQVDFGNTLTAVTTANFA